MRVGIGRHSRLKTVIVVCLALLGISNDVFSADKALTLGIFPRRPPGETMTMFAPLATYLSKALGREVKLETTPDFKSFGDAVMANRYDVVHLNQYQYIKAHHELGYNAIAKNEENHSGTIRGIIVVRKDSGISDIKQLAGRHIVFGGDNLALVSYVLPRMMLEQAGLHKGDYQETFALSPPNVPLAVYMRRADAGGTGEPIFHAPAIAEKIDVRELSVLASSAPVNQLPWAVRSTLPAQDKNKIRDILVNLGASSEGAAILKSIQLTNLLPAVDADYQEVRKVVKAVMGENY